MKKIKNLIDLSSGILFSSHSFQGFPCLQFHVLEQLQLLHTLYLDQSTQLVTSHLLAHVAHFCLVSFLKTADLINFASYRFQHVLLTTSFELISEQRLLAHRMVFLIIQEIASVDVVLMIPGCQMKGINIIGLMARVALV